MATNNDIRAAIDNSRLTTRLSVFGGIASLLLLILTIVLGMVRGEAGGADVFSLAVIPFSMALLFSLSSLVFGVLRTSAAQEEEEKQLLEKRRDVSALDVEEDVRFTAGRSFENYRRFAPYVLALLGAVMMAIFLIYFSRSWAARFRWCSIFSCRACPPPWRAKSPCGWGRMRACSTWGTSAIMSTRPSGGTPPPCAPAGCACPCFPNLGCGAL